MRGEPAQPDTGDLVDPEPTPAQQTDVKAEAGMFGPTQGLYILYSISYTYVTSHIIYDILCVENDYFGGIIYCFFAGAGRVDSNASIRQG